MPEILQDMPRDTEAKEDGQSCRICRGDGSGEEPLFHPCKCSGSIMYVHQNCLMEWLSHSNKKHCELCKTPFRFTKLYHPNMPSDLPTAIFLRKAASYTYSAMIWWARGFLVSVTWLLWLPWTMRFVWWGLFWLADVNWARTSASPSALRGDSPALNNTSNDGESLTRIWQPPNLLEFVVWLFRNSTHGTLQETLAMNAMRNDTQTFSPQSSRRHTLLSHISYLKPSPSDSRFGEVIIDVLEGQIITLALVAVIVLILLIREWVVQQQPLIHIADEERLNQEIVIGRHNAQVEDRVSQEDPTSPSTSDQDQYPGQSEQGMIELSGDENLAGTSKLPKSLASGSSPSNVRKLDLEENGIEMAEAAKLIIAEVAAIVSLSTEVLDHWLEPETNTLQNQAREQILRPIHEARESIMSLRPSAFAAPQQGDHEGLFRALVARIRLCQTALEGLPDQQVAELNRSVPNIAQRLQHAAESADLLREKSLPQPWIGMPEIGKVTAMSNPMSSQELQTRPSMPTRTKSSLPTEIQRRLVDNSSEDTIIKNLPATTEDWRLILRQKIDSVDGSQSGSGVDQDISHSPQRRIIPTNLISDQTGRESEIAASREDSPGLIDTSITYSKPELQVQPRKESWSRPQIGRPLRSSRALPESAHSQSTSSIPNDQGFGEPPAVIPAKSPNASQGGPTSQAMQELDLHNSSTRSQDDEMSLSRAVLSLQRRDTGHSDGKMNDSLIHDSLVTQDEDRSLQEASLVTEHEADNASRAVSASVARWLWGDISPALEGQVLPDEDDERIVDDINNEAPFVPIAHRAEQPPPDPQFVRAVAEAGINAQDVDVMEDVEDLEGVMELIGMQGPISGLLTNALFAAVFVSCAIAIAVWLPFLTGKAVLIIVAHPAWALTLPYDIAARVVNGAIDFVFFCGVRFLQRLLSILSKLSRRELVLLGWPGLSTIMQQGPSAIQFSIGSSNLPKTVIRSFPSADIRYAQTTSVSHASLHYLEAQTQCVLQYLVVAPLEKLAKGDMSIYVNSLLKFKVVPSWVIEIRKMISLVRQGLRWMLFTTHQKGSWLPTSILQASGRCAATNSSSSEDAVWSATDKAVTIAVGYVFFATLLALYLYSFAPVMRHQKGKEVEDSIIEALQQAGGIAKVVLIISIEMLAFPLYCGLLLDVVSLPVLHQSNLQGRLNFAKDSPWTALFVHWFVGTCYMFHFALFVSMCRKILRKGVLHFIRDPDDPTFHPVRDVLERSVLSQLRRITSSALLYGGLLILCLGSILWLLAYGMSGLLPIRWTSGRGILSFPFDLLLYVSLKPIVTRLLLPNEWLRTVYHWWFCKCARILRLSDYLLGDKRDSEPGWRRFLVPGNDQVRVGRRNGQEAWIEVDDKRSSTKGSSDATDVLIQLHPDYTMISLPQYFSLRIALFGACLWAITIVSGLCLTVLPLLLGRTIIAALLPRTVSASDVCALVLGMGFISAVVHNALQFRNLGHQIRLITTTTQQGISQSFDTVKNSALDGTYRSIRCLYVYGVLLLVLPSFVALLVELFVISPIHLGLSSQTSPYAIHYLRSWTLGAQGLRVLLSLVLWDADSRPARACHAVVERGYSNPRARLATRYFFLPMTVSAIFASSIPALLGWCLSHTLLGADDILKKQLMLRLAYPLVLLFAGLLIIGHFTVQAFRKWRSRIRDDVYLVGVRLISV